jgi:hypothetical protein
MAPHHLGQRPATSSAGISPAVVFDEEIRKASGSPLQLQYAVCYIEHCRLFT